MLSPSGVIYWGNRAMKRNNYTQPDGNPNHIDTVENVWVQDPEPGTWTVEVIAEEINEDGHVETPEVDADFALVVSGVLSGCGFEPADVNCDGDINAFDIEPFLVALFDPDQYSKQYPNCRIALADINSDGTINAFDIEPFLGLLFP